MATLIVGEEPCTIVKIVILELKNDLRLGVNNLEGLIVDMLYIWKGNSGENGTLEVLCKSITSCNSKDIADKLEDEFDEIVKAHILATGEVNLQGHIIKISDIFATTADLPQEIAKQFKRNDPIQILDKIQIPNRPTYYIQRSLSPRSRLNARVFKSASSDVFVLENMEWRDLDDKLFGSKVERSSTQTVRVTTKFILLDFEEDYEQICKAAPSDTPVHQVCFDRGSYYWVRSKGSIKLLQEHVSSEQEVWSEQQFLDKLLRRFENVPVCIADSSGMGKSLLLASIAQSIKESCPDRLVLFLVLRELEKLTNSHSAKFFWKQITRSNFAAKVLKQMMQSAKFKFELFLDGFDEMLPNQLDPVNKLLLSLKLHKNMRIHITTRPHLRNQVEETLGILSHTILPFTGDNQVQFLTRFWGICEESENKELDDSRLKSFANQCLLMVKNMNKLEHDIAGIPLQCAMLAEVFVYDAVKFSMKQNNKKFELTCKIESIFQMFRQLINKKMERIEILSEDQKQQLLNASRSPKPEDVLEAFKLIFPEWVHKLTCIQKFTATTSFSKMGVAANSREVLRSDYTESFLVKLYAVGLMEPSSSRSRTRTNARSRSRANARSSSRFVHRTFAEFLISEHLIKHQECKPCSRFLVDVVLGQLISSSKVVFDFSRVLYTALLTTKPLRIPSCEFRFNVISYFLNAQFDRSTLQISISRSSQNVDKMLSACCENHYSNIFHILSKAVLKERIDHNIWANMVFLGAKYSELNLMVQLVELIQRMERKNLSELGLMKEDFPFPVTPLHVAVQRGSYTMTRYLVMEQICPSLESLPYLLHSCVYNSAKDNVAIVKEKMEIINFLVLRRKEVIHEKIPGNNKSPLLLPNVHEDLILTLIEKGADVNAVDWKEDSVLHTICKFGGGFVSVTPAGYTKIFNLLQLSNFNLWNHKGEGYETPLSAAVKSIEVEHNVLDQYSQINVDFNHVSFTNHTDTVLFGAINEGRTVSFINKLEQLGADLNYLNLCGESALHIFVIRGNYDVVRYLITDRNFDVNHRDREGQTPLNKALLHKTSEHEAIQAFLIDNGALLEDPEYKWRPTPLFYALSKGNVVSLNIVLKMVEKGMSAEHLALALDPLVRNYHFMVGGKAIEYSKLFRYLYEHGGRIQNAAKKLKRYKREYAEDHLLERLKVILGNDMIHLATDLYDRIISGDIQLESEMLALQECNKLFTFDNIKYLLYNKRFRKFQHHSPEVREFIYYGKNMLVVAALDLELCMERMHDTIDGLEEYLENVGLLPGTLCLVKVCQQQINILEYLGGLAQLPIRFIVVCEESLAAVVEENGYKVVRDHFNWNDLSCDYQDEFRQSECIGFQLTWGSKTEFFEAMSNADLVEFVRSKRVSTDHLGRIIQDEVNKLDQQELKVLEEYSFKKLRQSRLNEIMYAECYYDNKDKSLEFIQKVIRKYQRKKCVLWFVTARTALNARWDNEQQVQEPFEHIFDCKLEHGNDRWFILQDLKQKPYTFKDDLLVFFMDWFVGRGYKLPLYFQSDKLARFTHACLNSNAVNLINHIFYIPNALAYSIPGLLHSLVQKTMHFDKCQLEVRVNLVLNTIRENPGSVNSLNQTNLPPLLMGYINVELIDLPSMLALM